MRVSQVGQALFAGCAHLGDLDVEIVVTELDNVTLTKRVIGAYENVTSVGGSEGNAKLRIEVQA